MRRDARENRDRILAAAEEVFGAAGAAGSTEEVARRAGVGVGTVFRHFPTKQQLIEATVVRHFRLLTDEAGRLAGSADPAGALRMLMETMVRSGSTKIVLLTLLLEEAGATDAVTRAAEDLRDAVGVVLRRAQQSGAVRQDVSVDELYLLIRGLSQAMLAPPVDQGTLGRALAVVLDGLTRA